MNLFNAILLSLFLFSSFNHHLLSRSIHRKNDPSMPYITAHWKNKKRKYVRFDSHYEQYPIFGCQTHINDMIDHHLLTVTPFIRTTKAHINTDFLDLLLHELVQEINKKKRTFKHFTILQDKNFNRRKKCGLLVLKCNDYPFVVKLFLETPATFVDPYCKGFEPTFLHYMSGGTNRHICGLIRITNRKHILNWAQNNDYWRGNIHIPRKWFWLPKKSNWITLHGNNIGSNKKELHVTIPATYALIADYVNTQQNNNEFGLEHNKIIMNLCNSLDMFVDPHVNNFIIKKNKRTGKPSVIIIDTEHFPTMTGLKQKKFFPDHTSWISYLAGKCLEDIYFRSKKDRINEQKKIHNLFFKK